MINQEERQKMDNIFKFFEDNKFEDNGSYSREMNLVFQFSDWIDSDEGYQFIIDEFGLDADNESDKVQEIRGKFSEGINSFIRTERSLNYPFLF